MEFHPGDSSGGPSQAGFVDSPNGWLQLSPSVISWSIENRPNLVRFGETPDPNLWRIPRPKLRCGKRKLEVSTEPQPLKMHISEDKMADQLRNMHISNSFIDDETVGDDMDQPKSLLPSLSLSKEVQNLRTYSHNIIPEVILEKMKNPSRALVLWQPPSDILTSELVQRLRNKIDDETANMNNNTTTDIKTTTSTSANQSTEMEL